MKCIKCGSQAINEHHHGRNPGFYSDLCDVCYWREAYNDLKGQVEHIKKLLSEVVK